jgi:hypothetical protein
MSELQQLDWENPPFDPLKVRQTILKLTPPAMLPLTGTPSREMRLDPEAIAAWNRLIAKVATLGPSESGMGSGLPPTPELLTPYVLPEACAVLDTFKSAGHLNPQSPDPITPKSLLIQIEDWIPTLLWYAVRSSEVVMRLISGIPAHIFQPEQGWQGGMVRLVLGLQGQSREGQWFFDLASDRPCAGLEELAPLNPKTTQIQSDAVALLRESVPLETLIAQLVQQLQRATPELARFLNPTPVEFLQPGSPWQGGEIQLTLDFEFVSDPEMELTPWPFLDPEHPTAAKIRLNGGRQDSPHSTLPRTSEQAIASAILPLLEDWRAKHAGNPRELSTEAGFELIPQFVAIARRLLDSKLPESSIPPESSALSIDELASKLIWKILGSGLEGMQFMAGVQGRILQPEREWEVGRLRLVGILTVQTPQMTWEMDLATGHPPSAMTPLAPGTVLQTSLGGWGNPAIALEQFCRRFSLDSPPGWVAATPDLASDPVEALLAALLTVDDTIGVEVCPSEEHWQSGWAQFHLAIEFISR